MAAPSEPCDHHWEWLPEIQVTVHSVDRLDYANVKCTSCGTTAWAHGRGFFRRPRIVSKPTPTTGRS